MKESIGSTWIFIIVISFILLFTALMCLTINNSKAFAVRSEVVKAIENKDGIEISNSYYNDVKEIINKAGYYTTGKCTDGYTGFGRDGKKLGKNANDSAICIKQVQSDQQTGGCYYDIRVFYRLELPAINSIFNFTAKGKTKVVFKNCNQL